MLSRLRAFVDAHVLASAAPDPARIVGFDLARSVAIGLMILVNFQVYLLAPPTGEASDVVARWLAHVPSGRSSSLFVILAGVGVSQMSRRAREIDATREWWALRATLIFRSLFLLCCGACLIVVWEIDILHFYAAYLALAVLFVRRSDRALLGSALAFVAIAVGIAIVWPEELRAEVFPLSAEGIARNFLIDGIHPVFPWLAFLLYGMWLGRRDLSVASRRRTFLFRAAALAVGTELFACALSVLATSDHAPAVVAAHLDLLGTDWTPAPLYVISAWGTGTFIIALAHEAVARFPGSTLVRALVATGQLSLSIYLFHALVGVGIPRWALHLGDALPIGVVALYWAAFFALTVPLAAGYRRLLKRGPVELVMRGITGTPERWIGARPIEARARAPIHEDAPAPSRSRWALVALGGALVLTSRVFGLAPPRTSCGSTTSITDVGSVRGELSLLCPRTWLTLDVTQAERATFSTRSGVDVYLEVHRAPHHGPATLVAEDDDSGPGLDARLTTELAPGRYDVLVRPYSAVTGPFALQIVREAPSE
jgi:uncharacterized protein